MDENGMVRWAGSAKYEGIHPSEIVISFILLSRPKSALKIP